MGGSAQRERLAKRSKEQVALRSLLSRSGIFGGIGPARANMLVERFGQSLHDRILSADKELYDVLPRAVAAGLIAEYPDHANEIDLARWLDSLGIDRSLARRILRCWGSVGAHALRRNPYLLVSWGESWTAVDIVGRKAEIPCDDPRRLVGAVEAALSERREDGHTWTETGVLARLSRRIHGVELKHASEAIDFAVDDGVLTHVKEGVQGVGAALMERQIAAAMTRVQCQADLFPTSALEAPIGKIVMQLEAQSGMTLDPTQKAAVTLPLTSQIAAIAGYAGAGKTTVLSVVFAALKAAGYSPQPMALAGRAARRLTDAAGVRARTITSVQYNPLVREMRPDGKVLTRSFHERDVLVIDEASMVDVPSLWDLIRKTRGARILMVGDPAQLPPIGAGKPFVDILNNVPTVTLEHIYRQGPGSGIPKAAASIREGTVPKIPPFEGIAPGVSFVHATQMETPTKLQDIVQELSSDADPDQIQILASLRKTPSGTENINRIFSSLNGSGRPTFPGAPDIRQGDPVIFVKNDVDRDLSNGSMGRYLAGRKVLIEGKVHVLDRQGDEKRIEPAYAMTIHKSQGSEWRRVIFVIHPNGMLDRSLVYTAITRAAEQVVIIGNYDAFVETIQREPAVTRRDSSLGTYLELTRNNA